MIVSLARRLISLGSDVREPSGLHAAPRDWSERGGENDPRLVVSMADGQPRSGVAGR